MTICHIRANTLFKRKNGYKKHLTFGSNYVLLRRFSSKDDKKRLIASILNPDSNDLIGIDNHLNYIGYKEKGTGLTESEQMGLFALFNSSLYETYFRCISGNTQVNATEIRQMKFPGKNTIKKLGTQLIGIELSKLDQTLLDNIVNQCLEKEFS